MNRLARSAALIMLVAAILVLYSELKDIRLADVVDHLKTLSNGQLAAALALTVISYLLLTGYDFLALDYAKCTLRFREVVFASFIAFAFTNTFGFALVSGGSTRYRIYSGYGLTPVAIGEVVAFCTITYALGVASLGGLIFVSNASEIASTVNLSPRFVLACGVLLLAIDVAYLVLVMARRRPILLGSYALRPPTIAQALMQIVLASVDQAAAAAVLYTLLPANVGVSFPKFLGVYLVAAPLSLLTLVPAGLGVLETALVVMLSPAPKAALFGSLLAYRCIYFLVPFLLAIAGDVIYETKRAARELVSF